MLQSGGRVVALDSRQDMFTWRRVPMLGLQMGEQCVRKMVGVVAREGLLAARAALRRPKAQSVGPLATASLERLQSPLSRSTTSWA